MKPRWIIITLVVLLALMGLGACGNGPSGVDERAVASMSGPEGAAMGTVVFAQGPDGVLLAADVSGLSPGPHGFHIHTVGVCTPDFAVAGGHFDPDGRGHGFMHAGGWHAGDMSNIHAGDEGVARADYFTDRVTLVADAGAGDRVACGVIERS